MRIYLLIGILLLGVVGFSQNKTANIKKGNTYSNMSFTAADTINESQTYYIVVTNYQNYPAMQDVWIELDSVTGAMSAVVTVYGKKFSDDSYTSIGSVITLAGFETDTAFNYPVTTANRYRYWKIEVVTDATDQQMLVTDVQFKNWFTGGEFSTTSLNLSGTLTVTGITTITGGIALPTASTHIWTVGGSITGVTDGNDAACTDGDRYWTEIMIPYNVTITGASYLVGSVGGTDSVVMQMFNSAGTEVATSKTTGATHGAIVGTTAEFQNCDFVSPYAAVAGVYYLCVQFNGTTAKFRTYTIPNSKFVAGTAAGTWDTKADITPGTTFTANKGVIILTY